MKTKIIIISILITATSLLKAQCDLELVEKWKKQLEEDNVSYLKEFSTMLTDPEQPAKYSIVLSKGSKYRLYLFESDKYDGKGKISLYEDERLLATNYMEATNRSYPYFDFKCMRNGVYHIFIELLEGEKYCANGILAFVEYFDMEDKEDNTERESENKDPVYFIVDNMPRFKGKDQNAFRKYLQENIKLADESKYTTYATKKCSNCKSVLVFVYFIVNTQGEVTDSRIVRGVNNELNEEALKVVNSSPKWTPGTQKGIPKNVAFTFPIVFFEKTIQ